MAIRLKARIASMVLAVSMVVPMLTLLTLPARAQEAWGIIDGVVLDESGRPVATASVTVTGASLPATRGTETDGAGYFRILALPPGEYRVRVEHIGYRTVVYEAVVVRLARTTGLGETRLAVQAVELDEVTVVVERPLIDVSSAESATNLPSETFESLPTERDFRSITFLAPQVSTTGVPGDELNVAGSTGPENVYFVDGVNVTDPQVGAGSSSLSLPYNFVREVQVKVGGYEAEYGRALGGIINVVTPSGGNDLKGQLFGFYTGSGLSGTPKFAVEGVEEDTYTEWDIGGSLEGPIVRDRLWFFAAYNPSVSSQNLTVPNVAVPSDKTTVHRFAGKLTWRATPSTDVTFTLLGDPASGREIVTPVFGDSILNPEAAIGSSSSGGYVVSGEARHRIGRSTELHLALSRYDRKYEVGPGTDTGTDEPVFVDWVESYISGGWGSHYRSKTTRNALRASVSTAIGPHALKAGFEYEDNKLDDVFESGGSESGPQGWIHRWSENEYSWLREQDRSTYFNRIPTAYLQDSWRVSRRLTLNLGLRWENQNILGTDGAVAQSFPNLWQPRAGVTYQLGELGTQSITASFGRFYEQVPLNIAIYYFNGTSEFAEIAYDHDPRLDPTGGDTIFSFFAPQLEPNQDLKGQYFDEFGLGYERSMGTDYRMGIRGIHRTLRWAIEDAVDSTTFEYRLGNPGEGALSFLPRAERDHWALTLSLEKVRGERLTWGASYVLSRNHGNYEGLYDYQQLWAGPNTGIVFDYPDQIPNSRGLLPNDRTHQVKGYATVRVGSDLRVGTFLTLATGVPRDEFGTSIIGGPGTYTFLQPRGSVGRTPTLFDANLRLSYALPMWTSRSFAPRLQLDVFHIGNARTTIKTDDVRYQFTDGDGNQDGLNENYGQGLFFQDPMRVRLGMVVDFF